MMKSPNSPSPTPVSQRIMRARQRAGNCRTGIRVLGHRGNPTVRKALVRFVRWLRTRMRFPVRVPIYLSAKKVLICADGRTAVGVFFYPNDLSTDPYIRIATGDYADIRRTRGRDDSLAAFIQTLAHEVVHYEQWVAGRHVGERGASRRAARLLKHYSRSVRRP